MAAFGLLAAALAGCGGEPQTEAAGPGHRPPGGPGGRSELPPAAVAVKPVARGPIATYYNATATLEPHQQADVIARVSGLVRSLEAEEGDRVAAGDPLLRLEDAEYRQRFRQAEAEAIKQRARFERLEQMYRNELVSAEEFESVRSDLLSAEAAQELAALELSYTVVTAPFTGHVITRHVDPGQMVSSGIVLFTMADLSLLRARVHVPAKEFRAIRIGQAVELAMDASGDTLAGRITLINPMVDPESGTIKVTVDVQDYPSSTRPGDFADVRIVTDAHPQALLVPKVAVIEDKGQSVVYVASSDSTAQRRTVEIGYRTDRQTEILAGVEEGERVVVQGQRSLEDGQRLKIFERLNYESDAEGEGAGR